MKKIICNFGIIIIISLVLNIIFKFNSIDFILEIVNNIKIV